MPLALALLCAALAADPLPHAANPVFQQVLAAGPLALPAPTLADGLSAADQHRVLQELCEDDQLLARFLRPSQVAPDLKTLRDIAVELPKARGVGFDFWFAAYGDLKRFEDSNFLKQLWSGADDAEGEGESLEAAALASRGIAIPPEHAGHEHFGRFSANLLKKVQLEGTVRSFFSRSDESIIVAAVLDPRFASDAQFPNQWRPMTRDELGRPQLGPATPYDGLAMYLKITALKEPAGALLIECHGAYVEPQGWFGGENLLASKYPLIVQNRARAIRLELTR
jgi:hypothetical protein